MCVPICPAFRSRGGGRWRRHASAWRMPRAGPGRAALNREHPGSRGWLGHGRRPRRGSAQHGLRLAVGRREKKPEVPGQVHTCHLDTAVCWRARDPTSGDPPSHPLPGMNGLADRQAERAFLAGTVYGALFTRVPDASQLCQTRRIRDCGQWASGQHHMSPTRELGQAENAEGQLPKNRHSSIYASQGRGLN